MKALTLACFLALTACHKTETQQIGTPSFAGISEQARPEAEAAFQHAKLFISKAKIDTAQLDLSKPQIFHRPGSPPPFEHGYDWSVQFSWTTPSQKPPYGLSIAVKNDGTCWIKE